GRKGNIMFKFQRVFAMSSRGRTLKSIVGVVLPVALIAMVLQAAFPHATVRAVAALATPMYGCTSPSDCVSKMTLPEKEGQMTQVEHGAFSKSGNSNTDIKTYFIGSVLS